MPDGRFILEGENGQLAGFRNLFSHENALWWRTGKWLVHAVVWIALLDMLVVANLYVIPMLFGGNAGMITVEQPVRQAAGMFFGIAGLYLPVGIVILAHDAIIREREMGTMAWIMSKPASRAAFVLSKMASNALAIVVVMVLAPGIVAYGILSLYNGSPVDVIGFIGALGIMALLCLFYLGLTILLGTITQSRYVVIGFGIAFMFLGLTASGLFPDIAPYLTWNLSGMARDLAMGNLLPSNFLVQLIAAIAWASIMAITAIRQIERVEI